MKQLLIISGKGGTGKTTIAGAFIKLSGAKAFADCDVEAPNMHLLLNKGYICSSSAYYGLDTAMIDPDRCNGCGRCLELCRFSAVSSGETYAIDPRLCEGCALCMEFCPAEAISMKKQQAGRLELCRSEDGRKIFSGAELNTGSGTSGKLVAEVKNQLKKKAGAAETAVIDGPPGTGCPVIASLNEADMALIVTEPSVSGINDMKRVLDTLKNFKTKAAVCINKYDMNTEKSEEIKAFCRKEGVRYTGRIPFDPDLPAAAGMEAALPQRGCHAENAIKTIFFNTMILMSEDSGDK